MKLMPRRGEMQEEAKEKKKRTKGDIASLVILIVLAVILVPIFAINLTLIIKGSIDPDVPPDVFGVAPMAVTTGSMDGDEADSFAEGALIFVRILDEENIHYGNYSGGQDGIWYGEGASSIHIAGGTFAATDRSGLYFAEVPNGNSVQLSGGVFSSERSADHRGNDTLLGNNRYWYNGGAISAATTTNSLGSVNGVLGINRNNIIAGNISLYGADGGQLNDTDTVARMAQYTYIRVGAA